MNKYDVIIFDGKNTAHKAYHVNKNLSVMVNGKEKYTGMAYGFLSMMAHIYELFAKSNTRIYIVWDSANSAESNREINSGYKSNRIPQTEQDVIARYKFNSMMSDVIGILSTLNIMQFRKSRVEADDIIASMSVKLQERDKTVLIVTEDKDYRQLISKRVNLYGITQRIVWDENVFTEKTGLQKPSHFVDYLAICGDSIDGFYGVSTFGDGKAMQLLTDENFIKYDSVSQAIMDNPEILDEFDGWIDKVKVRFVQQLSSLNESYQLAKLDTQIQTVELIVKNHYEDISMFVELIRLYKMRSIEKDIDLYERIFNSTHYWHKQSDVV